MFFYDIVFFIFWTIFYLFLCFCPFHDFWILTAIPLRILCLFSSNGSCTQPRRKIFDFPTCHSDRANPSMCIRALKTNPDKLIWNLFLLFTHFLHLIPHVTHCCYSSNFNSNNCGYRTNVRYPLLLYSLIMSFLRVETLMYLGLGLRRTWFRRWICGWFFWRTSTSALKNL